MKRILILCLVLLCLVPFASAAALFTPNTSLAYTAPGFVFKSETTNFSQIYTPADMCAKFGMPTFNDYTHVYFKKISDGSYWAFYDYPIGDQPVHFNAVTLGVDPTLYNEIGFQYGCVPASGGSQAVIYDGYKYYNQSSDAPAPMANFTGSPIAGTYPLNTAFTDTSTNETTGCTYNWTITPLTNVTGATGTLENHAATFNDAGNYTVSHGVSCPAGSNISTKTNYIWVYAPNETETTYFYTYNPLSGYEIHNSNIYLNDIENSSWVNSTDDADGRLGITALSTHHINAYSDKEGFGDGELLNQLASGLSYPLIMFPSNVSNVSAGNVTLYINVIDTWAPGTPVSGATVSITYAWPAIKYATTNEAGMVSFEVPNNTLIQMAVSKAGYTGTNDAINSGTGSGGEASVSKTLYITKKTVTTAPTVTTGPGGETPEPTIDPYPCVGDGSYQDTLNCQRKQGEMGADIIAYGPELVNFFIMLTFIGGLALMMKGFK